MKISPKEVCQVAGITYRQLQYWEKNDYVNGDRTEDNRRDIQEEELLLYVAISSLKRMGFSVQKIVKQYLGFLESVVYGEEVDEADGYISTGPALQGDSVLLIDEYGNLMVSDGTLISSHELKIVLDYDEVMYRLGELRAEAREDKPDSAWKPVELKGEYVPIKDLQPTIPDPD